MKGHETLIVSRELFTEITNGVYLLKTPLPPVWSGILLIRGQKNYLVDSGADAAVVQETLVPALEGVGLSVSDVDWLLNTHCHGDHIGGHATLKKIGKLKVAAYKGSVPKLKNPSFFGALIREKYPEVSPPPNLSLEGVETELPMEEGELLDGRLELIHTPGHDDDAVCWFDRETGTLISGDSIQANGSITQGIAFYQDLQAYRETIRKLQKRYIEHLAAAHEYDGMGYVVHGNRQIQAALARCLQYTEDYGGLVKKCLQSGMDEPVAITQKVIRELGCAKPKYLFLAMYSVAEHIREQKAGALKK